MNNIYIKRKSMKRNFIECFRVVFKPYILWEISFMMLGKLELVRYFRIRLFEIQNMY